MNINFSIEIDPEAGVFEKELSDDLETIEKRLIKQVVERTPDYMRQSFVTAPSRRGGPPAIRTGNLSRTARGYVVDGSTGVIELAGYAEFLDPDLGGSLDRPFTFSAIKKSLEELV